MTGISSVRKEFHDILWRDAELVDVAIDYSDVVLTVRESTGSVRKVVCEGYVGYRVAGFGDEVVIESAELEAEGEFLESCLRSLKERLGAAPLPSGNEARNRKPAMQLTVIFQDGCELIVAAKGLRTEPSRKVAHLN